MPEKTARNRSAGVASVKWCKRQASQRPAAKLGSQSTNNETAMARINPTLDQDEVLGLLTEGGGDAFKLLLQETLNGVLREKSAEQLCAQPYEQTQERTDSHNETKARSLTTRVATIELKVSRQRNAPFETLVTEVIVAGVFTVKVGRVIEEVCERSFSKQSLFQSLFEACAELDCAVRASCDWPLKGE